MRNGQKTIAAKLLEGCHKRVQGLVKRRVTNLERSMPLHAMCRNLMIAEFLFMVRIGPRARVRLPLTVVFLAILVLSLPACLAPTVQTDVGDIVEGRPFRMYSTTDRLGRTIRFYISEPPMPARVLPLVVYVQGTGCSSHFTKRGANILKGVESLMYDVFLGQARVLIVEKPGVRFLDDQGELNMQESCRPEFFFEHTLERWAEAIVAAIRSAHSLPLVSNASTLVVGISEGGIVAVRVSNLFDNVTHVASLSGGGPNHLYVAAEYIRQLGLDPEQHVYDCWQRVQKDPQSTTKFCFDHPFRHLSGSYRTSLIEECLKSSAKLYLVHGSADKLNAVAGFDMMRAELAAKGRSAVFERLEGAGHHLDLPSQVSPDGLLSVFGRLAGWFLGK